jgi:hypothetical protein
MELSFSVLARNRQFAKAMRRIRPLFAPLVERFAEADLPSAIHQAILIGITDDKGPAFFKQIFDSRSSVFALNRAKTLCFLRL